MTGSRSTALQDADRIGSISWVTILGKRGFRQAEYLKKVSDNPPPPLIFDIKHWYI
jgi:hypothetical protein